ncbi:protein disulfide-isomerase TMX3-like [Glandiceps talaboti]
MVNYSVSVGVCQFIACFLGIIVCIVEGRVTELDDRFLQARNDGNWLVQFYAPWCGHCKRLAPVWSDVGSSLAKSGSSIRVAKIDCTRYSNVADEFGVRGFPTIKFVRGDKVYTHQGARTKEDIIDFAEKAKGPAVHQLKSRGKFYDARGQHDIFFLYVGSDDTCPIYEKYQRIADDKLISNYFYSAKPTVLPDDIKVDNIPAILVFKDDTHYRYEAPDDVPTKSSILEWIGSESLPAFVKITSSNLHEIAVSGKFLVIGVVDSDVKKNQHRHDRVKTVLERMALHHRDKYHKNFQFCWMDGSDTINNIIMSTMPVPGVLVFDPNTHHYYLPEDTEPSQFTLQSTAVFLTEVKNGSAVAYGGNGILRRIYRLFYEFISSAVSIWLEHPIVTTLIVSIPTLMISFMCYTICTTETYDEDELDEDEMNDGEDYDDDEGDGEEDKRYLTETDQSQSSSEKVQHIKSD